MLHPISGCVDQDANHEATQADKAAPQGTTQLDAQKASLAGEYPDHQSSCMTRH